MKDNGMSYNYFIKDDYLHKIISEYEYDAQYPAWEHYRPIRKHVCGLKYNGGHMIIEYNNKDAITTALKYGATPCRNCFQVQPMSIVVNKIIKVLNKLKNYLELWEFKRKWRQY